MLNINDRRAPGPLSLMSGGSTQEYGDNSRGRLCATTKPLKSSICGTTCRDHCNGAPVPLRCVDERGWEKDKLGRGPVGALATSRLERH
eukprot:10135891-Alexandrium_andersonii.AAC.1